jgi:hypothetical protein
MLGCAFNSCSMKRTADGTFLGTIAARTTTRFVLQWQNAQVESAAPGFGRVYLVTLCVWGSRGVLVPPFIMELVYTHGQK